MSKKSQNVIEEIIALKKKDLSRKTQNVGLSDFQTFGDSKSPSNLSFIKALVRDKNRISLIAEIKFASPTHTDLGKHEDVVIRAKEYKKSGAEAISLITEKHYFKGDGKFISQIKENVSTPVLQKDFVIDPYQIYEAKRFGSDALLLIARLVDGKKLKKFVDLCFSLGIEPVVEINNEEDLQKALETKTNIIAVNARDFETLTVSINNACVLMRKIPDQFIKLGFSGIHSANDVLLYKKAGANGILIGTSLMQTNDIEGFIKSLKI